MDITPWITKVVSVNGLTIDRLDIVDYVSLSKFLKRQGFQKRIDINGRYEEFSHLEYGLEPRQTVFHFDSKNQIISLFINDFMPVF